MRHIDVTITSVDGCTVHAVGEIGLNLKLEVVFHGTITLGGGPGCPKAKLTFARVAVEGQGPGGPRRPDLLVAFDDPNIERLSQLRFKKGTKSVPRVLTAKATTDRLVREVVAVGSRMARDMKKTREASTRGAAAPGRGAAVRSA